MELIKIIERDGQTLAVFEKVEVTTEEKVVSRELLEQEEKQLSEEISNKEDALLKLQGEIEGLTEKKEIIENYLNQNTQ